MDLLAKIRMVNAELQKNTDIKDILKRIPELVYHLIETNIYIFSSHGNLLGAAANERTEHNLVYAMLSKQGVLEGKTGIGSGEPIDWNAIPDEFKMLIESNHAAIVPIICGRENYGSIFFHRQSKPLGDADRILVEYVSSFLGLKLRRIQVKRREAEAHIRAKAQLAIQSLTHSELEAAKLIFQELGGKDGLLIASEAAKNSESPALS